MKTLKKLIPLSIVLGCLSSCTYYNVKPGPKANVIGTYELVKYEMNKVDEEGNEIQDENGSYVRYDRKAEIGAVAYFSIADDGYAYYAYKDKNTAPKASTMFATFTLNGEQDEDHPEYVRSVSIKDGVTHLYEDQKYVGCMDEPSMGFRDELFKKTLHYNLSGHMLFQPERKIPYQYVLYQKVSNVASLAEVNRLMGTNFEFNRPYEMKAMTKYAVYHCSRNLDSEESKFGIYDYAFLNIDEYDNGTVKLYYKLKGENPDVCVSVPVTITEKGYAFNITAFGKEFKSSPNASSLPLYLNVDYNDYDTEVDPYVFESFAPYNGEANTVVEMIQECLNNPNI